MRNEFNIGCHLSASGGYLKMGKKIIEMGGNTFQFFTRNPRGGSKKPLDLKDIEACNEFAKNNNIEFIVAHAPYTMNLCSKDPSTREFALRVFKEDLEELEYVDNVYFNFHPGSHVGLGKEAGSEFIINALNTVIKEDQKTMILLETMAGKGTEIGSTFQELKHIIDNVRFPEHVGVCLDTCHVLDSGYDIANNLDEILDLFDQIIGLDKLKAIHLNDSKFGLSSHKDRHEKIGLGQLGLDAVKKIITSNRLNNLPFVLETPNEEEGYVQEIKLLKEIYQNAKVLS